MTRRLGARGLRRALAVMAAAALGLGVIGGAASTASAAEVGTLSGRMVSALAQTPLAGDVVVRDLDGAIVTTAATGDGGRYRIDLAPGTYTVQFRPAFAQDAEAPFGYPPAFYRDSLHASGAEPVVVESGVEHQIDGEMKAAGALMGNVTGATGDFALALVESGQEPPADPFDGEHFASQAQDDGGYVLPGAEGSYQLALYVRTSGAWRFIDLARAGESFVIEPGQPQIVDAYAGETGAFVVGVHDPSGAPVADQEVALRSSDGIRVDGETDGSGVVVFTGLEPDDWDLSIVPDDDSVLAPLLVQGVPLDEGDTVTLPLTLGDPLPAGATATPSTRAADGVLHVAAAPLHLSVPGDDDLDGVSYVVSDAAGLSEVQGDLAETGGTWAGSIDLGAFQGDVTIAIVLHRSGGWTEQTLVPALVSVAANGGSGGSGGGGGAPAAQLAATGLASGTSGPSWAAGAALLVILAGAIAAVGARAPRRRA